VRVFGIDPGSQRTGFGCVESDGRRHRLVICGAIRVRTSDAFATRLSAIYRELTIHIRDTQPDIVAIENLFHANNVRSALLLGHARGVAMLAAVEAGVPVVEYTPAEVKRAVVGYGRAEKPQVQQMIKLLLGLAKVPSPHDAADALAVAICHLHAGSGKRGQSPFLELSAAPDATRSSKGPVPVLLAGKRSSWRKYKPAIRPA
jgi:crossover junction endodeoxyribonuclease RuvC